MSSVPRRLRQQVIARAGNVCEYCQNQQEIMLIPFEADHIIPESRAGATTLDNLALACPLCNIAKRSRTTGFDEVTKTEALLFNPRTQRWSDHFQWSQDFTEVLGRIAMGRATVAALTMNDSRTVVMRRHWHAMHIHPPRRMAEERTRS